MKKEIAKEKTMTTKEVAEVLGITTRAVTRAAAKYLPNKKIEKGKKTCWTEAEITVILEQMKSNNNRTDLTSTTVVEVAKTSLTANLKAEQFANQLKETDAKQLSLLTVAFISELQRRCDTLQDSVSSLQVLLDNSKEYASVKRMDALNPMRMFNWRKLKAKSDEMGIEPKKVFDENYGYVNAYHKSVWESCYELDETPWE